MGLAEIEPTEPLEEEPLVRWLKNSVAMGREANAEYFAQE
jgi:hypothetical protein